MNNQTNETNAKLTIEHMNKLRNKATYNLINKSRPIKRLEAGVWQWGRLVARFAPLFLSQSRAESH